MVSGLLQETGGLMIKLNLTDKTGNRDAEYYLTGLGLKSEVCDFVEVS